MKTFLHHKGYLGSVEVSIEDNCLFGKIEGINDLVNYEAETVEELQLAFEEALNDYILTCEQVGKKPEKTYSGVFNVRAGKERHSTLVKIAFKHDLKLNQVVNHALDYFMDNGVDTLSETTTKPEEKRPLKSAHV